MIISQGSQTRGQWPFRSASNNGYKSWFKANSAKHVNDDWQNVGRTIPPLPYFLQNVGEMSTIPPIDKMSGEMAPFLRSCASFSLPPGGASAHMTSDKDQACLDVYVITLPKPVIGSVNKMSG